MILITFETKDGQKLTLDDRDVQRATRLGGGDLSKGISAALKRVSASGSSEGPYAQEIEALFDAILSKFGLEPFRISDKGMRPDDKEWKRFSERFGTNLGYVFRACKGSSCYGLTLISWLDRNKVSVWQLVAS